VTSRDTFGFPVAAEIDEHASRHRLSSRPTQITRASPAASIPASSNPMPELAPVTTHVFPRSWTRISPSSKGSDAEREKSTSTGTHHSLLRILK
jgi:hypothetical protein